jgi:hypothetical protein
MIMVSFISGSVASSFLFGGGAGVLPVLYLRSRVLGRVDLDHDETEEEEESGHGEADPVHREVPHHVVTLLLLHEGVGEALCADKLLTQPRDLQYNNREAVRHKLN